MAMHHGYGAYKRLSVETASGPQLLLALYDGAIKYLMRARTAVPRKDYETVNDNLTWTQDIVCELMATLDLRYGEIPQQLMELYVYMHGALVQANVRKDTGKIAEVEGLLRKLRAAWSAAIESVGDAGTPPAVSAR